ncbi:MAG: citramalate synthase [Candidatus Omnitrophica bacterium]|nr:citramalate synthase [Candidatus Omnitrophota bacterium]MBU4477681.1 citramalate synthase [Candidatus Omnitrophota bacterium]MCG2703878.1 citramalate synthase [Candidatus Omnitrophota bacterium]
MRRVTVYDTTLRDGAQTEGISYSVNDKILIARKLDELGMDFIEGGWPGSNPKDMEFFQAISKERLKKAKIAAFGSTRRKDKTASKDANIKALVDCGVKFVTIFGKAWDLHVKDVLKVSLDENLKMIADTVSYLVSKKISVFFDAEHFFDGYRSNPDYALKALLSAQGAGAAGVVLCDTNGGTLTSELTRIISEIRPHIKGELGIHVHNDNAMAVANSVAAVQAGCTQVQGTINGYGERCGNADLCAIIACLRLKLEIDCLGKDNLKELTEVSLYVSEISNMKQQDNQPFVGSSAFAHKAGVHINAMLKNPMSYEHVRPEAVGNKRRFLTSELAGKTSILFKAKQLSYDLQKNDKNTKRLHKLIQKMEYEGYQFEAAEASFELLIRKTLEKYEKFFELEGFRVIVEKRRDNTLISEATVKINVHGARKHTASEGDGPVNALDAALRKALRDFYPELTRMHLSDFKVRVLDSKAGTAAKVRVFIESQDEKSSWWTVGVSENIIEASWQALVDSIEYKLLKERTIKKQAL